METLIGIKQVSKMLGVCEGTLRVWDNEKKLIAIRTRGNHRRYRLSDIVKIQEDKNESN